MAIALSGSLILSGSITVSGSIISTGTISMSGSIASASYASNADTLDGLDSTVFTLTSSFAAQTASFTAFTSSINSFSASILAQTASLNSFSASILTFTGSAATRLGALEAATASLYNATSSLNASITSLNSYTSSTDAKIVSIYSTTSSLNTRVGTLEAYTSSLNAKTSSFATTGSNTFIGTQTITGSINQSGSFTSTGTITAQTLVVQTITSSVDFVTGSTRFGTLLANTHQFTGSISASGSLAVNTNVLYADGTSVGIGTTSPIVKLHIKGGADYNTVFASDSNRSGWGIAVPGTSTAKASGLLLASDESFRFGTFSYYHIVMNQSGSTQIYNTASAAATTFAADGNVGIGTTSPAYKLEIAGTFYASGTSTFAGSLSASIITATTFTDSYITMSAAQINRTAGAVELQYNRYGNGRIFGNTAYPIVFTSGSGAATFGNRIQITSNGGTNPVLAIRQTNAATQGYDFETEDVSVGRLDLYGVTSIGRVQLISWLKSSGNVGIGTTAPAVKTHLYNASGRTDLRVESVGGDGDYATLQLKGGGTNAWWTILTNSSGIGGAVDNLAFYKEGGSAGVKMVIQNNGNVGIGTTSPGAKLEIGSLDTNEGLLLKSPSSQPRLQFYTGGATTDNKTWDFIPENGGTLIARVINDAGSAADTWLRVTRSGASISSVVFPSGNVGIGTTSPAYELDVVGGSIVSRRAISAPRISSAGAYTYSVTNSPTWSNSLLTSTNNNVTSPDGNTSGGTYNLHSSSYDGYQNFTGITSGVEYTVGVWVKLGTATNFCIVVNNTAAWNTIGGKSFDSNDGLSTSKWTHISYTFTGPASGQINLHIGGHDESITQQTVGTVYLWNWEITTASSTWVGKVDDEIRLPGSSIWTSRGNVGIGTTSPAYLLDVNGTGRFSGVLSVFVGGNDTRLANFSTSTYGSARGLRINSYQSSNGGQDCAIEFDSGVVGYGGFKLSNSGTPMLTLVATGAATFSSSVTTAAPSGGTAKPFKIGAAATVTPTSQNRTIEIEIDGTTYYLTAKTTNN